MTMETLPVADRDRLRVAFEELKRRRFWAREDQEGGWKGVPEDMIVRVAKVIFWHRNETAHLFDNRHMLRVDLHLRHFKQHADEIAAVLESVFPGRVFIDPSPRGGVTVIPSDARLQQRVANYSREAPPRTSTGPRHGNPHEILDVFRKHCGDIESLINDLQATDYARRSGVFLTLLARLRKTAGLPPLIFTEGPKELLELIERINNEETRNAGTEEEAPDRAQAD